MSKRSLHDVPPDLSLVIHQAALDPHLDNETLKEICEASLYFNFAGLCTNLVRLPYARKILGASSPTKLIAVIGFPFGAIPSELKLKEVNWAAAEGAEELDVVPNFLALKENKLEIFAEELAKICSTGIPVRVVLDIAHLSLEKLDLAIEASLDAGVIGVQAGNGFGPVITSNQIYQLVDLIHGRCEIKAAGGIKTLDQGIDLIKAGASHLGTSYGSELITSFRRQQK